MLNPAFIFTDHAVLQCDAPIYVWGESDAAQITVSFGGKSVCADVKDGKFLCTLPSMEANIRGELRFATENESLSFSDVVTGEVWLAGGQSNMEHPTFCTEYEENDLIDNDNIRFFTVPRRTFYRGETWGYHFESIFAEDTPWQLCSKESALHFTAIGYFFAKKLASRIDVPIGIISCNWGATPVEAWTSRDILLSDPLTKRVLDANKTMIDEHGGIETLTARYTDYQNELKAFCLKDNSPDRVREKGVHYFLRHAGEGSPMLPPELSFYRFPSVLRENMLSRVTPYALRGVIWHQGESNTSLSSDSKEQYIALYRAMTADWRNAFNNPTLPFYTVQLAGVAWHGEHADYWSAVRNAQEELALNEKNIYMTVSYDLSEPDNIHPAKKKPMGERLAAAALDNTYGVPTAWKCPTLCSVSRFDGQIVLDFDDVIEWHTSDGSEICGFYLYFEDKAPCSVTASANGRKIVISDVDGATFIGYSQFNYSYTNLYNENSLPLTPFKAKI